ncbi:cupin domain-containing protein [Roseibium sp.]|uniref:cupin domain-containing protein n=1 Tax=Roseibium sp. TaxID=1936156 RepID=UPI003D1409B4
MIASKVLPILMLSVASTPFGVISLHAEEKPEQTAETPKAKSTLLLEQKLEGLPGYVVQVVLVEGPPGWVGGKHYHPGHIFGYILEGSYEFNFDNMKSRTVGPGEVFYETPNSVMRSRNGSDTEWVRDVVFHLKREEDPAAVSVD